MEWLMFKKCDYEITIILSPIPTYFTAACYLIKYNDRICVREGWVGQGTAYLFKAFFLVY